jgi:branched-chain amino acid transport system substrate-binding protein
MAGNDKQGRGTKQRGTGRRRFLKTTGVVSAGLTGLTGTTGAVGGLQQETVRVGANFPLSGNLGYTGGLMANAAQLAAMIRNENGGIDSLDGAQVEVVRGDNQAKQELGAQVTNELINDDIDVLTGCWLSSVTLAAAKAAERAQVPFVTAGAASERILLENDFNWVYRVQATTEDFGRDWGRLTPQLASEQDVDVETVGFFRPDNIFGEDIIQSARENAENNGLEVVEETVVQVDATSADSQATRLKGVDPDIVAPTGYDAHGTLLMNAFQDLNYRPKMISAPACATFGNESLMRDQIGDSANGVLDCNFALNPNSETAANLSERFSEEFDGEPLVAGAAVAYTSTYVTLEAIDQAGTTNPTAVNEALKNIEVQDFPLAMPSPITFDSNGENENSFAPLRQVQNFQPKIVWPEQFASTEPQSF